MITTRRRFLGTTAALIGGSALAGCATSPPEHRAQVTGMDAEGGSVVVDYEYWQDPSYDKQAFDVAITLYANGEEVNTIIEEDVDPLYSGEWYEDSAVFTPDVGGPYTAEAVIAATH